MVKDSTLGFHIVSCHDSNFLEAAQNPATTLELHTFFDELSATYYFDWYGAVHIVEELLL